MKLINGFKWTVDVGQGWLAAREGRGPEGVQRGRVPEVDGFLHELWVILSILNSFYQICLVIQDMGQCREKELASQCNDAARDRPILRMQAIATACVYFRRFYARSSSGFCQWSMLIDHWNFRRSFKDIDPFLLALTCTNLASKVEEMGHLSHNKLTAAFQRACKCLFLW